MKIYVHADVTENSFSKLQSIFKGFVDVALDAHTTIAFADLNAPINSKNVQFTLMTRKDSAEPCSVQMNNLQWWPAYSSDTKSDGYLVLTITSTFIMKRRMLWTSVIYEPASFIYRPHITICKNINRQEAQPILRKIKPSSLVGSVNLHKEIVDFLPRGIL